jgi:hypothetical protein
MVSSIAAQRLHNQQVAATSFTKPAEVVGWLGAMQAQDYLGTLWAVGLRLPHSTETQIERALQDRTLVRTWPMRGTLHIVAAEDVRWLVELLAPRRLARMVGRRRQLGIDEDTLARSRTVCRDALQGDRQLTRQAMFALLAAHGIATEGQRGIHILGHLAQEGLLCLGARSGKQFTFALLDEWVPHAPQLAPDAALAEIARRYFTSHGPATVHDFARWTGLPLGEARRGLSAAARHLQAVDLAGKTYWLAPAPVSAPNSSARAAAAPTASAEVNLLPGFDEYMLGYQDRSAILAPEYAPKIHPNASGVLHATLVVDGQIQGVWHRTLKKKSVKVTLQPFAPLDNATQEQAAAAAQRYADFLELALELEWLEAQ